MWRGGDQVGCPTCSGADAVWAGLAAGYYTPKRAVGTRVSGFIVRELLAD